MKQNSITLVTSAVLVMIFGFMLFSYQVRQTEVAVVTTFGKYSRSATEPGFRLRWPWPIEKVYEFDKRLQTLESKYDPAYTSEGINILSQVYVGWRISEPQTFLNRFNGDVELAERTLEPVIQNAKSEVIGRHTFNDLVSTNANTLKFDAMETEMLERIRASAKEDGMAVELVGIKRLGLPESTTTAVFQRMNAERQKLITLHLTEGEKEAKIIRANADGEANEILAQAKGEATRIRGNAETEAARYYEVFESNPDLAVFLFQLKAMEESLKNRTHLILDQQTPPLNLLGGAGNLSNSQADQK